MKRMLINATHTEELRVALVDGQKLYDLDIESGLSQQKKANIYKGKITRIEPSLEAAFVDYGSDRHGFLPLKEISKEYFSTPPNKINGKINIREVMSEGQEIIVQVDKEERGNKGAALTTFISLAGRYLVLMPNNSRAGGISRRIEGEERSQLKEAMSNLTTPKNMGVIVRTAGVGRTSDELQRDLDYLCQFWESITHAAKSRPAPFLIYQESNVIIRAVRDYLRQDIGEVLVDDSEIYEDVVNFVQSVMPSYENQIKLYEDEIPLFSRYQIEAQIETAFQREVKLPSGGAIVIDPTEALVSIDINSARATRGSDIEETALQTNIEAAEEVARQLRLRDIGGLIVIDFIDMTPTRNQREVENKVRQALELDRARVQVGKISRFGLLEMSRQRLRPSLEETRTDICPRCSGQGKVRSVESLSLSIMRLIYEEASKDKTDRVQTIVPVPVATFLLNEKRQQIADIEKNQGVSVLIIPSPELDTPQYEVTRLRNDESASDLSRSYEISTASAIESNAPPTTQREIVREQAAVKSITPVSPIKPEEPQGLIKRISEKLKTFLASTTKEAEPEKKLPETTRAKTRTSFPPQENRERNRSRQNNDNRQQRRERPDRNRQDNDNRGNRDESRRQNANNRSRNDKRKEDKRLDNQSSERGTSDFSEESRRPRRDRSSGNQQQARNEKSRRPTRSERADRTERTDKNERTAQNRRPGETESQAANARKPASKEASKNAPASNPQGKQASRETIAETREDTTDATLSATNETLPSNNAKPQETPALIATEIADEAKMAAETDQPVSAPSSPADDESAAEGKNAEKTETIEKGKEKEEAKEKSGKSRPRRNTRKPRQQTATSESNARPDNGAAESGETRPDENEKAIEAAKTETTRPVASEPAASEPAAAMTETKAPEAGQATTKRSPKRRQRTPRRAPNDPRLAKKRAEQAALPTQESEKKAKKKSSPEPVEKSAKGEAVAPGFGQSETKSEASPEIKSEASPEIKSETPPEIKSEASPETPSKASPETEAPANAVTDDGSTEPSAPAQRRRRAPSKTGKAAAKGNTAESSSNKGASAVVAPETKAAVESTVTGNQPESVRPKKVKTPEVDKKTAEADITESDQ
ncbi:MAG: ribonuclease [Proteobacteria bacterium]|nr:MAG: ribonuclease [Pseudomonadota bacterium]